MRLERMVPGLAIIAWIGLADASADPLLDHLRAIDTVPSAAQLRALDPRIEERLFEAAQNEALAPFARARATSLLSLFPTDEVFGWLETLTKEQTETPLRAIAVYTLARSFGSTEPQRTLEAVVVFLDDDAVDLRERAARGLRWIDAPVAVRGLLDRRLKRETDTRLRKVLARVRDKVPSSKK